MSFQMTHNITVEGFKPFKCHSIQWKRHMDNYADYGLFVVPAMCFLSNPPECTVGDYSPQAVPTGLQFQEGMGVQFEAGYDGNNTVRFKGFIKRINLKVPLEVECEGYSYVLRQKRIPSVTYTNTSLRTILENIVSGTGITLSPNIPDVTVSYVQFQNCNGLDCLDWFKEKMLMTVYFMYDQLYVGLRYLNTYGTTIKNQLNWNVIKDNDLLFEKNKEGAIVNIYLTSRAKTGNSVYANSTIKNGTVKKVKVYGVTPGTPFFNALQADLQKKQNIQGYSGKITAFLTPVAELNCLDQIIDTQYLERNGTYVIEGVEGSFGTSGGRQKIEIGISV